MSGWAACHAGEKGPQMPPLPLKRPDDYVHVTDVTSTDPHEIARLWGVEVTPTSGGLLAMPCKTHCSIRQTHATLEVGEPGDVLIIHNQKQVRHIISASLFEFLFGEKL